MCKSIVCEFNCKPSPQGPTCYCGPGKQAQGKVCVGMFSDDISHCAFHLLKKKKEILVSSLLSSYEISRVLSENKFHLKFPIIHCRF